MTRRAISIGSLVVVLSCAIVILPQLAKLWGLLLVTITLWIMVK